MAGQVAVSAEDDLGDDWFGGKIDAQGKFIRQGGKSHKHSTNRQFVLGSESSVGGRAAEVGPAAGVEVVATVVGSREAGAAVDSLSIFDEADCCPGGSDRVLSLSDKGVWDAALQVLGPGGAMPL